MSFTRNVANRGAAGFADFEERHRGTFASKTAKEKQDKEMKKPIVVSTD